MIQSGQSAQPNQPPQLLLDSAKKRFEKELEVLNKSISTHSRLANVWGLGHITLGLVATILSIVSTAYIFNTTQTSLVATLSIVSAISSGTLTFLNPSKRESKRRKAFLKSKEIYHEIERLCNDLLLTRITVKKIYKTLDDLTELLKKAQQVNAEFLDS